MSSFNMSTSPYIIYISIDGDDNESFYKIRGLKNAYDLSHERFLNFLKKKKDMKSSTKIILSMLDFKINEDSILKKKKYWESLDGIDSFLHKEFITWNGSCDEINNLADISENKKKIISNEVQCSLPWEMMTITWDGDVVPCCFDYNKDYILGNLKKESLHEIWNGDKMQSLRLEFINNMVENNLCRKCEKLYLPRDLWEL